MIRKVIITLLAVVLIASAAYPFNRGYVHGTLAALYDQAHGRSRIYLLGCGYWPRGAYEERRDALLAEKYHLMFDTIGGIGPTTYAVQYQYANNAVTWTSLWPPVWAGVF
jgi:hypothetical protein